MTFQNITWNGDAIKADFWRKPIPTNHFDWSAWVDGQEESGIVGYGPTRGDAVTDLLQQLVEDA